VFLKTQEFGLAVELGMEEAVDETDADSPGVVIPPSNKLQFVRNKKGVDGKRFFFVFVF